MKYYLHDTSAFDDEKISELFIVYGYEGLGLFYTILEKIAKQEKPIKTSVLKHQLKVGKKLEKCWNFMESLGIISSNNGETFNEQLLNFSEKYKIKKEKNRIKISEWRKNQDDADNVTGYETISNPPKVKGSKVKESKVKESKVKKENIDPHVFYKDEIEKHNNSKYIKEYSIFYDLLNGKNNVDEILYNVLSIPKQVSYSQFEKLFDKSKEKNKKFSNMLLTMDNKAEYCKKRTSLSKTLHTWINTEF